MQALRIKNRNPTNRDHYRPENTYVNKNWDMPLRRQTQVFLKKQSSNTIQITTDISPTNDQETYPRNQEVPNSKKRIDEQSLFNTKVVENIKEFDQQNHENSKKSNHMIDSNNKKRSKKDKKTDVCLSDLIAVDDFIKLDSPLSNKEDELEKEARLQDVCLDDLLNANSLPVSMKDGDFKSLIEKENTEDDYDSNNKCNDNVRDTNSDCLMITKENTKMHNLNRSKIKIIEDFKRSADNTQKSSKFSFESDSSQSLVSLQNNILYKDDERLEPETDILIKNISNLESKNLNNPISRKGLLPSKIASSTPNRVSLNINIGNSNSSRERIEECHKIKGKSKNLTGSSLSNISKRSSSVKEIHNGSLINSNNMKILLNDNEHDNEVQIPIISFGGKSEPIILPLKVASMFSKIVATTEKTCAHDILNMTFPQYHNRKVIEVKYKAIKLPKKSKYSFSSKSTDTLDTGVGFRNLNILTGKETNIGSCKEPVKNMSINNYYGARKNSGECKLFSSSGQSFLKT